MNKQAGRFRLPAALVFALLLSGCTLTNAVKPDSSIKPSDNPVIVDNVTNDKFAAVARQQHPRILATYGGEYSDKKLELMVAKVVGRLTAVSSNPAQTYRITLLNSPNVNAFALPGGYLYITRGLLALANDSSELAAVIAHEMGHVTANHGQQRQQKEAEEVLAAKVVSDVLGENPNAKAALVRGKLRLAQFSRNQELEADAIGIKMIGEAGYDAFAAARFLKAMDVFSGMRAVSGASDASLDFLASHPNAPQRIDLALRHARAFGQAGSGEIAREAYLAGIDGMLFGDTPEEGYVRGRRFLHPLLGVTFSVPDGFVIDNTAAAVTAAGPGEVAVRFDGVTVEGTPALADYIRSGWVTGLRPETVRTVTINGNEAARALAEAGGWKFDVTVIRSEGKIYRLLTAAPLASTQLESTAEAAASSFRALTAQEKAALKPLRISVASASAGDTAATLAAKMGGVDRKLDLLRVLNAKTMTSGFSAGEKVKLVIAE